ncbi:MULTISPECIES: lysophospholipid acyltransferase family protein [unclassified Ochrobactrum]|jgi:1-acyl-sn-glycerol-3-phosphate acyltransferase|uniref:lysophospholipid acyltransferase family protein n=1 Tax=Brucella/Ochrobactrum group TaxID=2826938 RepID=UPI0015FA0895|nr:1-acyl-sn-glycerol-3-phosphate acyltransferase [Ochrobactrum sp. RH2CCR150]MDH7784292.1 1-acyl-sn-glycerol-3-phosphate acyltransferase [Ochrobactrum sp. 19YEA23]
MIGAIRVFLVLAAMVMLSLSLIPVQYVFLKLKNGWKRSLPNTFHRMIARLFGFRVRTVGEMHRGRPLLLVANHTSWSDIVVLSSVGQVSFIAKSEVRNWPIFGMFAVLQRTVFVERERRGKTGEQTSEIATRMSEGDAMVLFPEGTTSDGNRVLPFKTALFGAAHAAIKEAGVPEVLVQPVAIAYTGVHGMAMGRYFRPIASWPGDVELMPHLKGILREGAIDVEIRFGEPMVVTAATDRKMLARTMEGRVRALLQSALLGREIADD